MEAQLLLRLYRTMLTSRQIDRVGEELNRQGIAPFHLNCAGHESVAAMAAQLTPADWLHCHYRSRAMLLERGVTSSQFFHEILGTESAKSRGRRMGVFFSDPELKVLSMVTPVANNALQSVGVASTVANDDGNPIVVCSVGDGSTQQGEFLEALNEATRRHVPVLFFIEDNHWAISTSTVGKTFYSLTGQASEFCGVPIHYIDGRDIYEAYQALGPVVRQMREDREPAIVVFELERLSDHTSADDQKRYRDETEIQQARQNGDPLEYCRRQLLERGVTEDQLASVQASVAAELKAAEEAALAADEPPVVRSAKRPLPIEMTHPSHEQAGEGPGELVMRDAIREVLQHHLRHDGRVRLLGQDIEDPKGDVFGVTQGLSTAFPGRVENATLSESTILGVSIGQSLAGQRPVAFIQFADFLPQAFNQLTSELSTMYWRSDGDWECPVIVMAACGGYRPGLGPYHAQTMESLFAHTPGLDVFMPSTAADAAGMLNAAFKSARPTLFFYPKSILNDSKRSTSGSIAKHFVPIGPSRKVRAGRDITFVTWGSTVPLCEDVAKLLEETGVESEILDLRCLSPWDERSVIASAEKTARLVVVHEDNHTCGFGAEVLATVSEKARVPIATRRVARADTHVPCNFENQKDVLPSIESVLTVAAELLDLDVAWRTIDEPQGMVEIDATGSGPADEAVVVVELMVTVGAQVEMGDPLVSLEATKSVFELPSTATGTIEEILVAEGDSVPVGAPLFRIRAEASGRRRVRRHPVSIPELRRKPLTGRLLLRRNDGEPRQFEVGVSAVATIEGSRLVRNEELLGGHSQRTNNDVMRRTGIESRRWAEKDEDAITLGVRACRAAMAKEDVRLDDLDLLICSTTSPTVVTPSMACQVLGGLVDGKGESMVQAFDINAACSGYLYALQSGYDFLQSRPDGRVLIVTTEVLSPLLDLDDFDTAILFGDAASATILYGEAHLDRARAKLHRPDLSAKGDQGGALSVPLLHDGFIQMHGRKVFSEAVRSMIASLNRACKRQSMNVEDLRMIVPHQANQRILDAIQNRVSTHVYSNIRHHGNTSSTSIPLCLTEVLPKASRGDRLGLCAFGGGFTFGASILEVS